MNKKRITIITFFVIFITLIISLFLLSKEPIPPYLEGIPYLKTVEAILTVICHFLLFVSIKFIIDKFQITKLSKEDIYIKYLNNRIDETLNPNTLEDLKRHYDEFYVENEKKSEESIKKSNKERIELINSYIKGLYESRAKSDIFALMYKNNQEITEYFKISKSQSKAAFYLSIAACVGGLGLTTVAIILALQDGGGVKVGITAISGAIVEVVAGTVLWIHNKSLVQLNRYYEALHENEKFLSAVKLIDNISKEKQDEIYTEVIRKQIEKL